ncbi:MAG: Clp protease N-terminal domain-containing protein [Solirubrobacteraceae bacterium]
METLARRTTRTLDPQAGLRALTALRERLDELEMLQVSAAVEAGLSWTDIARAMGISRQAAHKRYSRRAGREPGASGRPRRMLVTAEARHAVQLAREEARALGADVVGTEHVLLGILRCERSHATWALHAMGARLDDARAAAEPTLASCNGDAVSGEPRHPAWRGLSPHARRVLERSLEEALERGEGYIGVEHLLLAVLRDERGGAAQTLRRMSIDPQEMLSRLSEL